MMHTVESLIATGRPTRSGECLIWNGALAGEGYGHVADDREMYVHRLVFLLTHGRPADPQAAHRCGRNACMEPTHIYEATQAENEADKITHGTTNHADRNGMRRHPERHARKLTDDDVRAIRASGESSSVLATRYGVHRSAVHKARTFRTWKSLT